MTARIAFDVVGLPVPQGSLRTFVRNGRAITTHGNRTNLDGWRIAIAEEARTAAGELLTSPVRVDLTFRLCRPAGHYMPKGPRRPSAPEYPAGHVGDIDRFARAALDALTGTVFADDAQVVELVARKVYVDRWVQPGVAVEVVERIG